MAQTASQVLANRLQILTRFIGEHISVLFHGLLLVRVMVLRVLLQGRRRFV
jgi:hypothetical protein